MKNEAAKKTFTEMEKVLVKIWIDDRKDEESDEGMNYWGKEALFINPDCEGEEYGISKAWFRGAWRIIENGTLIIDGDIFRALRHWA